MINIFYVRSTRICVKVKQLHLEMIVKQVNRKTRTLIIKSNIFTVLYENGRMLLQNSKLL